MAKGSRQAFGSCRYVIFSIYLSPNLQSCDLTFAHADHARVSVQDACTRFNKMNPPPFYCIFMIADCWEVCNCFLTPSFVHHTHNTQHTGNSLSIRSEIINYFSRGSVSYSEVFLILIEGFLYTEALQAQAKTFNAMIT